MCRRTLFTLVLLLTFVPFTSVGAATDGHRDNRHPGAVPVGVMPPVPYAPEPGGQVFFGYPGGYYDPFFWSYPWGPYGYYWYYDWRPRVRVNVEPEDVGDDAAVYVDGHFAGVVDDFDGTDQGVIVEAGPHTVAVYREGYRTARFNVRVADGETFRIRHTLEPLPAGERSESPEIDRPAPGSTSTYPRRRARPSTAPALPDDEGPPVQASASGRLQLRLEQDSAEIFIDGERWVSSNARHFVAELPAGPHRLEVRKPGFRTYAMTVHIPRGNLVSLDVNLEAR